MLFVVLAAVIEVLRLVFERRRAVLLEGVSIARHALRVSRACVVALGNPVRFLRLRRVMLDGLRDQRRLRRNIGRMLAVDRNVGMRMLHDRPLWTWTGVKSDPCRLAFGVATVVVSMTDSEKQDARAEALRELVELFDRLSTEQENAFAVAVSERIAEWRKLITPSP